MINLVIILLLVGLALYFISMVPLDARIKNIIYAVVIVGIVIWLLRNLNTIGVLAG